ncbi:hypothetical protein AVEN_107669-1 [Araneus ventricosus]|uniref:Uncharacterized protein n=1 Tax=Araneus ventricosus TaxID=182803 RepID=A0A4Y2SEP9_ARAVE|nr:hypothetical protein AVEN_107669-1 [Araneus ventricosus]
MQKSLICGVKLYVTASHRDIARATTGIDNSAALAYNSQKSAMKRKSRGPQLETCLFCCSTNSSDFSVSTRWRFSALSSKCYSVLERDISRTLDGKKFTTCLAVEVPGFESISLFYLGVH